MIMVRIRSAQFNNQTLDFNRSSPYKHNILKLLNGPVYVHFCRRRKQNDREWFYDFMIFAIKKTQSTALGFSFSVPTKSNECSTLRNNSNIRQKRRKSTILRNKCTASNRTQYSSTQNHVRWTQFWHDAKPEIKRERSWTSRCRLI